MATEKWSAFPSGGDMQIGDLTVGLRGGVNYSFTFPNDGIKDGSGNFLLGWSNVASATNYIDIINASTGNPAIITTLGGDSDPGMLLSTKGSGNIVFTPGGTGIIQASAQLLLHTNSPTTALEAASKGYVDGRIPSIPIPLASGGTSASLVASNGGIFYSTGSAGAILSGTATANQVLLSGSSGAPSWSVAVYPATTTINQILYSSANNVISGISMVNNGVLISSNTGVPSFLNGPGTAGNMLMTNISGAPFWSTATYADTYSASNLLYSSGANNVIGLATANNGVLITDGSGVPSIGTTLPSAVQGNITSLGTIASGVWHGTVIAGQYGGTGVNNTGKTITIGGNFAMSGAFDFTGTLTGITTVIFPTSGTLATTSQLPTLPLSLANGGTNASLTASNGGIVYSGASAFAVLAGTATAGQMLQSGSNTTPAWSTSTYPATNAINTLLYASAANVMSALATANSGVLVTSAGGVPSISTTLPNINIGTPTAGVLTNTTGGGGLRSFQIFTSGTGATYTKPAGITSILVEVLGGGGGGGGCLGAFSNFSAAGGGGSGGYARLWVAAASSTYTYTVGAGGAGGTAGANPGSAGGTTTFSASSLQATGGSGGSGIAGVVSTAASFAAGGAAGVGSNGNINAGGEPGLIGTTVLGNVNSGAGGSSIYGGGGTALTLATGTGNAATNYGSGGGGAAATSSSTAGGAGSAGLIIVWEFS